MIGSGKGVRGVEPGRLDPVGTEEDGVAGISPSDGTIPVNVSQGSPLVKTEHLPQLELSTLCARDNKQEIKFTMQVYIQHTPLTPCLLHDDECVQYWTCSSLLCPALSAMSATCVTCNSSRSVCSKPAVPLDHRLASLCSREHRSRNPAASSRAVLATERSGYTDDGGSSSTRRASIVRVERCRRCRK